MNSLDEIRSNNEAAERREWDHLVQNIHEVEAILGVPQSGPTTWADARRRLQNLKAVAASRIDPNDDGVQRQPIKYGEWLEKNGESLSPF